MDFNLVSIIFLHSYPITSFNRLSVCFTFNQIISLDEWRDWLQPNLCNSWKEADDLAWEENVVSPRSMNLSSLRRHGHMGLVTTFWTSPRVWIIQMARATSVLCVRENGRHYISISLCCEMVHCSCKGIRNSQKCVLHFHIVDLFDLNQWYICSFLDHYGSNYTHTHTHKYTDVQTFGASENFFN